MKKHILFYSLVATMLASCSKNDDSTPQPEPTPPAVVEKGGIFKPTVGGPNEPNQVFVDLSTKTESYVKRDSWDFGFYCGDDFRVILNSTIKMAAKPLETTNIDEIQTEDAKVAVGFTTSATLGYVDSPWGELKSPTNTKGRQTAIAEISATDSDNKVYLVNMGYEVGTTTPKTGGTALDGNARGWKKIRVTRNGNDYVLQYADLADTTHKTITIKKSSAYNFTFVSLSSGSTIQVQPEKTKWDISFTGLTNYTATAEPATLENSITYYFADMVITNLHGNTRAQIINTTAENRDKEYKEYSKAKASEINFDDASLANQLVIGSSWRNTFGGKLIDTVFYVIKDADGNLYKLKFLDFKNEKGERGYPVFEYELLQ
ncbi:MAG: HmuY family protein [Capnocytophaga sp.]|nr:HmuY family protein [Capnocytophaga sp.]